jgi:aspartyl-tRNA(Asn)/glutamyl-tRNA(Gln) amidotransferase subunit A
MPIPRDDEVCRLSAWEIARLVRRRRLSPVEVVRAHIQRAEVYNPTLNAYIALYREEALQEARRLEGEGWQGAWRGPLHGVPIALKDVFPMAGRPLTAGSRLLRAHVPQGDAAVVRRLKAAGAVVLGTVNLHEFAYGVTTVNPHYGPTRNPWDTSRIPGGSSGGSGAALAAGLCPLSLGTDTGGSVRIPAALCGVVGLKPTYGKVSRQGVFPLAWSLDHVGPMARTVRDVALLLEVLWEGDGPHPPFLREVEKGVKGVVLGVLTGGIFTLVDTEVEGAFVGALHALEGLGVRLEEVSWPGTEAAIAAHTAILMAEAAAIHEGWLKERPQEYGEDVRRRLLLGMTVPTSLYLKAQQVRRQVLRDLLSLLERVDALVLPTCPVTAPPIGAERVSIGGRTLDVGAALTRFVSPFNLTGVPALSVPCALTHQGLPVGFQIVGRFLAEPLLLRIGAAVEREVLGRPLHPPL